jgi:hypothetical protein
VWDLAWLEPAEYTTATVVAFFPKDTFDMLRLTTDIAFVRQDRIAVGSGSNVSTVGLPRVDPTLSDPFLEDCKNLMVDVTSWQVEPDTLFRRLTDSDREIVTVGVLGYRVLSLEDLHEDLQGQMYWPTPSPWWPRVPEMHASIQHKGNTCGHVLASSNDSTDRGLEDRSMFSLAGSVSEIDVDL